MLKLLSVGPRPHCAGSQSRVELLCRHERPLIFLEVQEQFVEQRSRLFQLPSESVPHIRLTLLDRLYQVYLLQDELRVPGIRETKHSE